MENRFGSMGIEERPKDCRECIYRKETEGYGDIIECIYPVPKMLTNGGGMFGSDINGVGCPLRKTHLELASENSL